MADVTILGGGVIGLSIADELARAGLAVRVLDRSALGTEASWAGAGMLPPGGTAPTTPEALLRGLSARLWRELSDRLRDETGIDNGFRCDGALRLYATPGARNADAAALDVEGVRCEPLDADDVRRLEPGLGQSWEAALHLPTQSQIRSPRHLRALSAAAVARGVELVPGAAAFAFETASDRVVGVRTAAGTFRSEQYVVATGAWTGGLLDPLGIELPVRPVRGQMVLLDAAPSVLRQTIEVGRRYLVPRGDGRILVGSTEEDAGFEKRTTAGAVCGLLGLAARICPALSDTSIGRIWCGLRPGSPDGLPYLGRPEEFENLIVAAGHFRSGLQMSPGTAVLVRQMLLGQPTAIPTGGFGLARHAASAGTP